MNAIVHTKLILEDGIVWDGAITFENGRIVQAGPANRVSIPSGTDCFDAGGLYTAPGLIDIHNHGGSEHLFTESPAECAEQILAHGVTTVLPTLYANLSREQMLEGAGKIALAARTGAGRIIGGLYMEGPYMCSSLGSFQNQMKWQGEIRRSDYLPLLEGLGAQVRVWAIDPARPGIEEFMKDCKRYSPEAVFSLGHSSATAAECRRVKKLGVRNQTHHSDSGKAPGFAQGTIGAGCDEFTLYDPDLFAELICDENGIHVAPDLIKLVVKTKGVERIILISDSMPRRGDFRNNEAAGIAYGPDLNYDDQGMLAGSRLTLDSACRNLMKHTGYGLCHAIRFASLNPARMLGIDDEVGSLEPGKRANLIVMDDMVQIRHVYLDGELEK